MTYKNTEEFALQLDANDELSLWGITLIEIDSYLNQPKIESEVTYKLFVSN